MIKDDIKNPSRIGPTPSAIVEGTGEVAIGLHSMAAYKEVGLVVSKRADETFLSEGVKAVILPSEKAHALGKALIELSGIEEVSDASAVEKPLHISLEEYGELREGDKVILRNDTTSDAIFKFGYGSRFQHEIQSGTPATVSKIDTNDDSVQLINSNGMYGWFIYKAVKEVIKAPRHISQEEFDNIEAGDKVVIRKDLVVGKYYGGTYFNAAMRQWAVDGVQLKVMPSKPYDGSLNAKNLEADDYFNYSKEMIQEVIKAPKEHFRVRLSTKIWYAGQGGKITLDKDYAAIMNKPHAENVVKKYGGQLIKVDYSELEDK